MAETASSMLAPWSSFYVVTGSAAASLTGLMFVVITLVTGVERARRSRDGISVFSTPTVVHFSSALFVSLVLSAPWRSLIQPAALIGLMGLYGVVSALIVMYRTRRFAAYRADLEDWTWYMVLPFIAYAVLLAGAIMLALVPAKAPFALAGSVALLIFIGIHNAWDVVTFLAIGGHEEPPSSS